MNYSLFFIGCPGLGTDFKTSKTSSEYIASFVMGFIPSRLKRCLKVLIGTFNSFEISVSVNPVISSIIDKYNKLLNKCTVKSTICYTRIKVIATEISNKCNYYSTIVLIKCNLCRTFKK